MLLATPIFSNLRRAYPNATLHALTGAWGRVVLDGHPDVDAVIEYNSPAFCRTKQPTLFKTLFKRYRELRFQKYDLMIELRGDWWTTGFALLRLTPRRLSRAALQIANKLGFTRFTGLHETTRNLDVLQQAGIPIPVKTATFEVTTDEKKWGAELLAMYQVDMERLLIAIHPGSPITLKRWLPERFAELADWLIARKRAQVLFVGVADELPIITEIQTRMRGESISIAGKTNLTQLASILHAADVFIGNDSGPMHLAAAVGTRTLGLYGPGDPTRFGPAGEKCQTIRRKADCPCSGVTCQFGEAGCMSKIQVTDVIQSLEVAAYLTKNRSPDPEQRVDISTMTN